MTFGTLLNSGCDVSKLRSMGSPVNVVAPMVDASELAWRMLGRRSITSRTQKNQFEQMFYVQARSTLGLHSDVACRMFHTGCKVQVSILIINSLPQSSKSPLQAITVKLYVV